MNVKDIKGIRTQEDFDRALKLMQEQYFLINLKGNIYVMNDHPEEGLIFTEPSKVKTYFKHLNLSTPIINTTKFKTDFVYEHFLSSGDTKRLERVDFDPKHPYGVIDDSWFNMWKGFKYQPKYGNTFLFQELLDANCDGDGEVAEYFLNYLALSIQKPWVNPRTAIAIIGEQGSGKGTLINDTILALTDNSAHFRDLKFITGEFNSPLRDAFYICLDECSFGGDIKEANLLKTFISENKRTMNEKYMKQYTVNSFSKVFILSNNDYIVNVEESDRRYVVMRSNNKLKGDFKWFETYHKWLNNGGYEAIMYELSNRYIEDFNPLEIPKTKEKVYLQLKSADLSTKFIYDLISGSVEHNDDLRVEDKVYRTKLYNEFTDWCKRLHQKAYIPSVHEFNKVVTRAFNFDEEKSNWRTAWKDNNGYFYRMKSTFDLQERFAKNLFKTTAEQLFFNYKNGE